MNENTNLNVLIVEDEPLISIFIKRVVKGLGENVIGICTNGSCAIETIKKDKPELIFMDINLKGSLDGINVIRQAKSLNYDPIVFYISAYSDKETIEEALSTNPYSYLIKPIKEEDIEISIKLTKNKLCMLKNSNISKVIDISNEYKWDSEANILLYKDKKITLTNYETMLFQKLMKSPNTTITYEEIHNFVYGEKEFSLNAITSLVKRARKKIEIDVILSSYGDGYRVEIPNRI